MPKEYQEYQQKLIEFGLSDKEAAVYLALLEMGRGTADQIAKRTKLNRSTTYVQIKVLMEMGMVSTFKLEKKTFFTAESPIYIERLLDRQAAAVEHQRSEAKQLLPDLMKIFASTGARPAVRLFEGKEGLVSMRNEILDQKPKEILIITSVDNTWNLFTKDELMAFTNRREKLKIKSYVIYSLEKGDNFKPFPHQEFRRTRKEQLPFGADVYIYNDCVSFASIDEAVVGLTVSSGDIANTMRALYWRLWNTLTES